MAEPFLGEIRLFSFGFAPSYWATCDGQVMNISQNSALYALLGTTFGGNGTTTFNLPDLRGRTSIHKSPNYTQGAAGGQEYVALASTSQLPAHIHALQVNNIAGSTNTPQGDVLAAVGTSGNLAYAAAKAAPSATMAAGTLSPAGGSAGHNNMQPTLTVNYCIALAGIWPSRD